MDRTNISYNSIYESLNLEANLKWPLQCINNCYYTKFIVSCRRIKKCALIYDYLAGNLDCNKLFLEGGGGGANACTYVSPFDS